MRTLEITTRIGCKNKCSYCPQDKLISSYKDEKKIMSFEDFKLLLNNVPKNVKIEFSGFSEAFLNKESSKMMKYSIELGYITEIYTTLQGFNNNDLNELNNVNFHRVCFHQYDSSLYDENEFNKKMKLFKQHIKAKNFGLTIVDKKYNNILSRAGNLFEVKDKIGHFIADQLETYTITMLFCQMVMFIYAAWIGHLNIN